MVSSFLSHFFCRFRALTAVGNLEEGGCAGSLVPLDQLHERENIRTCFPESVVDCSVSSNNNISLHGCQIFKCKIYLPVPGPLQVVRSGSSALVLIPLADVIDSGQHYVLEIEGES